MANNRFAQLSPDFEEEEKKRQKELKEAQAKKEVALKKEEAEKARKKEEVEHDEEREQGGQGRGRGQGRRREGGRGRGEGYRGRGRGERGRWRGGDRRPGGYHQGPRHFDNTNEEEYDSAQKTEGHGVREYKYTGNPNAKHPFDRHSGTGRGTEVPKSGKGPGNWGNPEDDVKNEDKIAELAAESPKEREPVDGEPKEGERHEERPGRGRDKRWKKKREKGKDGEEEKKEDNPTGPVYTLSEYRAMQAENMQGLTTKKPEEQLAKDPKAAANLKPHEKEKFVNTSVAVHKKKRKEKEQTEESKKIELGMETGGSARSGYRPRDNAKSYDKQTNYSKHESEKTEKAPFVMNDKDFPTI
jgi:hypothetical protein